MINILRKLRVFVQKRFKFHMAILLLAVFFQLGCECQCCCCCYEWRDKSGIGQDWSVEFISVWILCLCCAWRTSVAVALSVSRSYQNCAEIVKMMPLGMGGVIHCQEFIAICIFLCTFLVMMWCCDLLLMINQLLFLTSFFIDMVKKWPSYLIYHWCGEEMASYPLLTRA